MSVSEKQAEIIRRLKDGEAIDGVAVLDGTAARVGTLRPISRQMAESRDLLERLCRWRANAMHSFLTVFEPSVEKTQAYLQKFSLPDPARILFLIENSAGEPVGNIGLANVTEHDAEIDNVLRGEKADARGFMRMVQNALATWAMDRLGVQRVYLNVLSHNDRAIASYEAAGFIIVGKEPLTREDIEGGYRLVPAPSGARADAELIRMEIARTS